MSGYADAVFTCGAMIPNMCGEREEVALVNDGWYTNFNTPEGWHIELGGWGLDSTIVRCPRHTVWVVSTTHPDTGEEIPPHWEDAP